MTFFHHEIQLSTENTRRFSKGGWRRWLKPHSIFTSTDSNKENVTRGEKLFQTRTVPRIRYSENYRILRMEVLQNNENKDPAHRRSGTSTTVAIEEISPWQRPRTAFVVTIGILITMRHGRTIAPETLKPTFMQGNRLIYIKRMTNVYSLKMSKKS